MAPSMLLSADVSSPGMPLAVKNTTGMWLRGAPGGGPTSLGTALRLTTRAGHQSCPSTLAHTTAPGRKQLRGKMGRGSMGRGGGWGSATSSSPCAICIICNRCMRCTGHNHRKGSNAHASSSLSLSVCVWKGQRKRVANCTAAKHLGMHGMMTNPYTHEHLIEQLNLPLDRASDVGLPVRCLQCSVACADPACEPGLASVTCISAEMDLGRLCTGAMPP